MDVYLLPTLEGYSLFAKIEEKDYEGAGKGLVNKFKSYEKGWVEKGNLRGKAIKYFRKRLETKEEVIFRHANKAKELTMHYPSSMGKAELKSALEGMYYDGLVGRVAWAVGYGVLTPVSFVLAPFLPVLNWGFTAFFAYRFYVNLHVLQGSSKIISRCSEYKPDRQLATLEKIIERDGNYDGVAKEVAGTSHEFLLDYYATAKAKGKK